MTEQVKFSTKAEYGLKAAVNLAKSYPKQKTSKEIAAEEDISVKYLERLLASLLKKGLIISQQGKNGGYALAKNPKLVRVGEVVECLEGPIAPMKCVGRFCAAKGRCPSSAVWDKLGEQIHSTLYKIKLSDLI